MLDRYVQDHCQVGKTLGCCAEPTVKRRRITSKRAVTGQAAVQEQPVPASSPAPAKCAAKLTELLVLQLKADTGNICRQRKATPKQAAAAEPELQEAVPVVTDSESDQEPSDAEPSEASESSDSFSAEQSDEPSSEEASSENEPTPAKPAKRGKPQVHVAAGTDLTSRPGHCFPI